MFKMKQIVLFVVVFNSFQIYHVYSANLPGPLVYVVTPSSKPPQIDMGRAAPFYYHNWIKRMDMPSSVTPADTTTKKTETPDLIFAEFESDNNNVKSIRKLLEKEKTQPKTTTSTTSTTTSRPIYVPDEEEGTSELNYGLPQPTTEKPTKSDMTDYFALYNNLYNSGPVYVPSASASSVSDPSTSTTTTTTTTEVPMNNVENIWHIIDNEKHDQYSGKWTEESISSEQSTKEATSENNNESNDDKSNENQTEENGGIDDNFALPGFGTNPGNGGENESRAIRTEPNIRFPYVNLKPFKMKNFNSKKTNNMFDLGSFTEIKNPVRGEVQDTSMVPNRQPIDRYNPAQPYLPDYGVGTKSKQPSAPPAPPAPRPQPRPPPMKAVANLVPPPPPPAPKLTGEDFPAPSTYDSFPPYAPSDPAPAPTFSFPPTGDSGPDSSSGDDDGPPSAPPSGYRYKQPNPGGPAPPAPSFVPTLPPLSKPFSGYSYNKPPMEQDDGPPGMDLEEKPDFESYQYSKPAMIPSSPPQDVPSHSYGHHDAPPPSYHSEPDYPDLIYDKPHGGMGDIKGADGMKGNDMGMMPPPPPTDLKPDLGGPPIDDHGFPHDFPGDFKYAHDFDEHDYHHHHHHHPTTTTTTEMPRVNRFSYYYLGKKLYYLPLYFSVYFVVYVGALIIKAVLRHKITYPNSYRPNDMTAGFFSKRSIESHLSNDNLHEITGRVTRAIATAAEKYVRDKSKEQ